MTLRPDTEHEARQLAAKHFPLVTVQILVVNARGKESILLETAEDVQPARSKDTLLFKGLGQEAGPIDPPLAWTDKPTWKKGLWVRRAMKMDSTTSTQVLEWDGLGKTPDVELASESELEVAWLGPFPPLPF